MAALDTVLPPHDPVELANVEHFLSDSERSAPAALRGLFEHVRQALAAGSAVRVEKVATLLTTGEAAELLNVSRTTMVKLLEDGKLPFEQPNIHRLVKLEDVLAYKAQRTHTRKHFLDDLSAEAVATGEAQLTLEEYSQAIASVRHGLAR